jgi:penicillin-binding protein 1B
MIRSQRGSLIYESKPERKPVLDPRVAYLMVNLLEEVIQRGTAARVRSMGFKLPAAGKTGTSRDGWFAGFTSKLLCVVWVGFDDGSELGLEGAKSALPIWTEFMKRAHEHRSYRAVHEWDAPDGIVGVEIDPTSGQLATAACPSQRAEIFISGSQPVELCRLHSSGVTQVAGWEAAPPASSSSAPPQVASNRSPGQPAPAITNGNGASRNGVSDSTVLLPESSPPPPQEKAKEKRGFFGRIRDIFR